MSGGVSRRRRLPEPLRVRIDGSAPRLAEAHQRQVAALGHLDRQAGGGGNGEQDLDAAHGGFLHHFIAGAARHQRRPLQPRLLAAVAQQFVERHVAADVFTPAAECAVRLDPGRRVGAAGQFPYRLHLLQLRQRPVEQGQIEALREGQRRDGLGDLLQLLHPADAAAGAAGRCGASLSAA